MDGAEQVEVRRLLVSREQQLRLYAGEHGSAGAVWHEGKPANVAAEICEAWSAAVPGVVGSSWSEVRDLLARLEALAPALPEVAEALAIARAAAGGEAAAERWCSTHDRPSAQCPPLGLAFCEVVEQPAGGER